MGTRLATHDAHADPVRAMTAPEIIGAAKWAHAQNEDLQPFFAAISLLWPNHFKDVTAFRLALCGNPPAGVLHLAPVAPSETVDGQLYILATPSVGGPFITTHKGHLPHLPNQRTALYRVSYAI